MRNQFHKKFIPFLKGWGVTVTAAILIATSFKSAIAELNHVPTGSMIPTILAGDRIFVNKLAYDLKIPFTTIHLASWSNPQRGDIVVFKSPTDNTRLVKRVVGLPGDSIAMVRNTLHVNGKPVNYEEISPVPFVPLSVPGPRNFVKENFDTGPHTIMLTKGRIALHTFPPITVPEGHYFMLGDNRDNSADSRIFGCVRRNLILGKAPAVVYSLRSDHLFMPRPDRFFKPFSS